MIIECKRKYEFHRKNAKNALFYHNIFTFVNLFLTSSQALTMTIESVLNCDNITVSITGGVFAFCLTIFNRVQSTYNFQALSIIHDNIADDILQIINELENNLIDVDSRYYHTLKERFQGIIERSHIQNVSTSCKLCF